MDSLAVECLRCGTSRIARRSVFRHLEAPECPACGYLGWAHVAEQAEPEQRPQPTRRPAELRLTPVA